MSINIAPYRKSILVGLLAFLSAVGFALTDNTLTGSEVAIILSEVLTALGVYAVPNARPEA